MNSTLRKYISLLFVLGASIFPASFIVAQERSAPIVETKIFPHGSRIHITLPDGFSGKVIARCYDGVCTSTSSPATKKDIEDMTERIEKQRKEMEDFFKQQQALFEAMFNDDWVWNW